MLSQRVIRLLLGGTPPSKILCLTFTKAAAANMATSVFDKLAAWTALDDRALDDSIYAMSNARPQPEQRARARRLFAQALDTPGGLKVQTIHAFCTRLLQQFPFEANVPARFAVLDEASESQLLEQLTFDALLAGAAQPDGALGRALATIIGSTSDQVFRDVLGEAIRKRSELMGWIDQTGGIAPAIAALSATLGLAPDETTAEIAARFFTDSLIAPSEWPAICGALAQGSSSDIEQSERLRQLAEAPEHARLKSYLAIFCTQKGEPRKTVATKAIKGALPERLRAEQQRICDLLPRWRAAVTRDRTAALITIAGTVIKSFRAEKDRRGLLDYDDLIEKTGALLTRVEAAWVHYKLDLGIDHVLIDEAQDTSPRQWAVIERLVAEFAAGEGARGQLGRTIFAVGDDKQSIFSFQGALPEAFAQKRRGFQREYEAAGLRFLPLELKHSFRSVQTVLDAVDLVFKTPGAFRGLDDPVATVHTAVRRNVPGLVEIWPLIEPEKTAAPEGWDAPFDTSSETSPKVALARRIARCVADWIARGIKVGDGARRHAITPGDILILVRQRGPLFEAVIRALKNAGIAVAGADRLILTEHIAVMDLLALADALLLPDDDLALATVLKSPLFGLDEDELFGLAFQRGGTLRNALRAKADASPALKVAAERLDRLAAAARRETPFGFYAGVLGAEGGRKRFLARIGPEATDALDELLNIALDYERRQPASLQGFVAWLRSANAEVKRDMEISRDEVRVMTVHGAKGLEAPVVFLADTTTPPAGPPQRQPRLLRLAPGVAPPDTPGPVVWAGRRDEDVPPVTAARDRGERSRRERASPPPLCGDDPGGRPAGGVRSGGQARNAGRLLVRPGACGADAGCARGAGGRRRRHGLAFARRATPRRAVPARVAAAGEARSARPAWLDQAAPPDLPHAHGVSPSRADEESIAFGPMAAGAVERNKALARGTLVHRLLQALPAIAPEARTPAAQRHLARAGALFSAAERDSMLAQVRLILEDPRFAELFGAGSRAEVPIVGRISAGGRTIAVSGQVDRLAVTPGGVLIADYKTNRPAPRRLEDVPRGYLSQLALYRAVLCAHLSGPGRPGRPGLDRCA